MKGNGLMKKDARRKKKLPETLKAAYGEDAFKIVPRSVRQRAPLLEM